MQIGLGIGIPFKRNAILAAFNPSNLFNAGEQGVWYDPSDFDRYMAPLGPELVMNGDFSNGTTGWSGLSSTLSVSGGGALRVTKTASNGQARSTISTVIGKWYKVSVTLIAAASNTPAGGYGAYFGASVGGGDRLTLVFGNSPSTPVTLTGYFLATTTTTYISLYSFGSAGYDDWDNISVRELTAIDTATLFQDSAGTTPVTAVEQPVGLMLDKSKGLVLGSEQSPVAYGAVAGVVITGTTVTVPAALGTFTYVTPSPAIPLTDNSTYLITYEVTRSAGSVEIYLRGNPIAISTTQTATRYAFSGTAASGLRIGIGSTFVGSIKILSVRELPGNHAFQTTSTSRPVLSARYNLLLNTGFSGAAVGTPGTAPTSWSLFGNGGTTNSVTSDANGNNALTYSASAARQFISQAVTANVNTIYRLQVQVGSVIGSIAVGEVVNAFAWPTGTTVAYFINGVSASSADTLPANSSVEIVISVGATAGTGNIRLGVGCTVNSTATVTFSKPDLRVTNDAAGQPAYQRVNTATDYDTTGFKPYLRFDGTDDWMQTNSINFTGTDKMTVFAGVRKLSDAATGVVVELSTSLGSTAGSFGLFAPPSANARLAFGTGGTADVFAETGSVYPAPLTSVLTASGDISGASAILRGNGTQLAQNTNSQGTGNYGSYPLYIGRRGGTTLPFNGRLYGLIVRGAATDSYTIESIENYMGNKVGSVAPAIQGVPTIGVIL